MDWADFFSMDGRAFYVWGSFGAMALCMLIEVIGLRMRANAQRAELAEARAASTEQIKERA